MWKVFGRGVVEFAAIMVSMQASGLAAREVYNWKVGIDVEDNVAELAEVLTDQTDSLVHEQEFVLRSFRERYVKEVSTAVKTASQLDHEVQEIDDDKSIKFESLKEYMQNLLEVDLESPVDDAESSGRADVDHYFHDKIKESYRALPRGYVDLPNMVRIPTSEMFNHNFISASLTAAMLMYFRAEETKSYFNSIHYFLDRHSKAKAIESVPPKELVSGFCAEMLGSLSGMAVSIYAFKRIWPLSESHTKFATVPDIMRTLFAYGNGKKLGVGRATFAVLSVLVLRHTTKLWIDRQTALQAAQKHDNIPSAPQLGEGFTFSPSTAYLKHLNSGRTPRQMIDDNVCIPPIVWKGAKASDPLTFERIFYLLSGSIGDEVIYRMLLFQRMCVHFGPTTAALIASLTYWIDHDFEDDPLMATRFKTEDELNSYVLYYGLFQSMLFMASRSICVPIFVAICDRLVVSVGELVHRLESLQLRDLVIYKSCLNSLLEGMVNSPRACFSVANFSPVIDEMFLRTLYAESMLTQRRKALAAVDIDSVVNAVVRCFHDTNSNKIHGTQRPHTFTDNETVLNREQTVAYMTAFQAQVDKQIPSVEGSIHWRNTVLGKRWLYSIFPQAAQHYLYPPTFAAAFQTDVVERLVLRQYPDGMNAKQLRDHITFQFAMLQYTDLLQHINPMAIVAHFAKYAHMKDDELLDLIDKYFNDYLNFMKREVLRFNTTKKVEFLKGFGGRHLHPDEVTELKELFAKWMSQSEWAGKFGTCMMLDGMTLNRLKEIIEVRGARNPAFLKLWDDWNNYMEHVFINKVMKDYSNHKTFRVMAGLSTPEGNDKPVDSGGSDPSRKPPPVK
jgi:hypothetical protein